MSKIRKALVVCKDMCSQIQGNPFIKIEFLISFVFHYLLKQFGLTFIKIPKMRIRVENCIFETRPNTIDFWMLWKGYEQSIFIQLYREIMPGDTFIDIGANLGRYTILIASRGNIVYAFEPVKSTFDVLLRNISLNHLNNNIKAFNLGLGDRNEFSYILYLPYKQGEASLALDIVGKKELIKLDRLDDLSIIPENNCFLKIDVEGFEFEVLQGAKRFIESYRPKIIIEIWSENSEAFLRCLGYHKKGEIWYPPNGN